MPLFLSTFVNKVDRKGRLSVPAPFRAALASQSFQGVVLFKAHTHACLEGFDYGTMDELSTRLDTFDLFSNQQDDLASTIFGEAVQLPFDSEGRVMIPEEMARFAGLAEQAAFVGMGRKFQIWNPDSWAQRRNAARENVVQHGLTLPAIKNAAAGKAGDA